MDFRKIHQDLDRGHLGRDAFLRAPVALAVIVFTDDDCVVVSSNPQFNLLLGGEPTTTLEGASIKKYLAVKNDRTFALLKSSERGLERSLEMLTESGQSITCLSQFAPMLTRDGAAPLFVMTLEDISARREAVTEMMRSAGEEQREDFVATLTHDLKTPIVGANMVLSALLDGTVGTLQEEQSKILGKLLTSNKALLKMIQNLVEVYKYESGNQSLLITEVDAIALTRFCLEDVKPLIANKSQVLEFELPQEPVTVYWDEYAIKRLLINLLANAIKFTPEKGLIKVSLQRDSEGWNFHIADTGSGIKTEDKSRLFQRFWQGKPGKRYAVGTGLGLYFCHSVAKAHGGSIAFESTEGKGTVFTVHLPERSNA